MRDHRFQEGARVPLAIMAKGPNCPSLNLRLSSVTFGKYPCHNHHSGREFGSQSLEIHIKACMKKWEVEQASKPVHERKRIPLPPESFPNVLAGN